MFSVVDELGPWLTTLALNKDDDKLINSGPALYEIKVNVLSFDVQLGVVGEQSSYPIRRIATGLDIGGKILVDFLIEINEYRSDAITEIYGR